MDKKQRRICVISQHYPDEQNMIFAFLDQLVCQFADQGAECFVIAPTSGHAKPVQLRKTKKGNQIFVFRPHYLAVPHRSFFGFDTYRITMYGFYKAAEKVFRKEIKTLLYDFSWSDIRINCFINSI